MTIEFTGVVPMYRTEGNYDTDLVSAATGLSCPPEEDKTQQQFKDEADINEIVRRFGLTGQLPEAYAAPQSGDFTGITDFHTAMNAVTQAQEKFMQIPAEIRARFSNDPARLIDFVSDERNRDEAQKLGLIPKPPETTRPETVAQSAPGTTPAKETK